MANYELRIETTELRKSLDVLSTVVSKKVALPILSCVCIRYNREKKFFTMVAGNTEQYLTIECWRPDEKADKCERLWMFLDKDDKQHPLDAFCIDLSDYREVFQKLPSLPAQCVLTINEQGEGQLKVNYGKGEFVLPVLSATDYPKVTAVVEKNDEQREGVSPLLKFSIETNRILPIISAARVCAANDELRPVMNTVCMDCYQDRVVVVSSDGHSLFKEILDTGMGWMKYGCFPVDQSAKLLIPTQAMSSIVKAFAPSETITFTADTQRISIQSGDGIVTLNTVSIDGNYPNYESVIPKDNQHKLVIDRQELNATLSRISFFSAEGSNLAVLRRDDEHVILNANDEGFGRNADEHVAIINPDTSLPDGFEIGFKISTMQQLLGCITSDNLTLEIGEPKRAMLLKEEGKISSLTLLIMPMVVQ